jgi:hypothetical protein
MMQTPHSTMGHLQNLDLDHVVYGFMYQTVT